MTNSTSKKTEATHETQITECNKGNCCSISLCGNTISFSHLVIMALLLINIIIGLIGLHSDNVEDIINRTEAMKVGGEENYKKLQKIMTSDSYKQDYAQRIDMMLMQMEKMTSKNGESVSLPQDNETGNNNTGSINQQTESTNPETRGDE